jgi:hypothetical protein
MNINMDARIYRTAEEIAAGLSEMFDQVVLRHGFTDYSRDYDVVVDRAIGLERRRVEVFRFRGCAETSYKSLVRAEHFSMDDSLTDKERWDAAGNPEGYVWG